MYQNEQVGYLLHSFRVLFRMQLSAKHFEGFSLSHLYSTFVTGRLFGLCPPEEAAEALPQL